MLAAPYQPRDITENLPFDEQFSGPHVDDGSKTVTSRNDAKGVPGDYFYRNGKKYVLDEVFARRLGYVAEYLWKDEGARSPAEFREIWVRIYGRRHPGYVFNPDKIVYTHYFKQVAA